MEPAADTLPVVVVMELGLMEGAVLLEDMVVPMAVEVTERKAVETAADMVVTMVEVMEEGAATVETMAEAMEEEAVVKVAGEVEVSVVDMALEVYFLLFFYRFSC